MCLIIAFGRRLALSVLPDGAPTLIVRTLEAFMALQWQAGVLTEEVVLAVQGLVEVSVLNDKYACCRCIFFLPSHVCVYAVCRLSGGLCCSV